MSSRKSPSSLPFYAITIHKSQGLTFDRCTVHTKTFAAGQLYVGLSRCSNIEGLTIFPKMEKNRLHASREVIDFYARMEKKASEGTVQLECPQRFSEQVKAYIADLLEKEKAAKKQAAPVSSAVRGGSSMGARRRTRQGLSIHVESVLGKGISMQIETVAKRGFCPSVFT